MVFLSSHGSGFSGVSSVLLSYRLNVQFSISGEIGYNLSLTNSAGPFTLDILKPYFRIDIDHGIYDPNDSYIIFFM